MSFAPLNVSVGVALSCVILLTQAACTRAEDSATSSHDTDSASDPSRNTAPEKPAWQQQDDGSWTIAHVNQNTAFERDLQIAIEKARSTLADAQLAWEAADANERQRWLVKWAVTADHATRGDTPEEGVIEYLWVRPVTWSDFRVEGVLVSSPVHEVGVAIGDPVAFPIESVADWVYCLEGSMSGPRQGGFTIEVLESHFGKPVE
ncbi:MAG: DUF2314 domain-containing protein [Phycisphaerales bacterium]